MICFHCFKRVYKVSAIKRSIVAHVQNAKSFHVNLHNKFLGNLAEL